MQHHATHIVQHAPCTYIMQHATGGRFRLVVDQCTLSESWSAEHWASATQCGPEPSTPVGQWLIPPEYAAALAVARTLYNAKTDRHKDKDFRGKGYVEGYSSFPTGPSRPALEARSVGRADGVIVGTFDRVRDTYARGRYALRPRRPTPPCAERSQRIVGMAISPINVPSMTPKPS